MWALNDHEFGEFQRLLREVAGIHLTERKKALVCGRLARRLAHHGLAGYADYLQLLRREGAELQIAVDLLTTNETSFFREMQHFHFLRERASAHSRMGRPFRVWSAACSSGQEAYSAAMVLADVLADAPWEVLASDLCTEVLTRARGGQYALAEAERIPRDFLRRFCLRGVGPQDGTFIVQRSLRERVRFAQINLNRPLPEVGLFDVIFLRNVMIYFDVDTKREVIARLLPALQPGGHLLVGHAESLNGLAPGLEMIRPSVYRKP